MIRITTLVENGAGEHTALTREHGLSFCVEAGERMVLFDTGQSGAFMENARRLRIDLSRVERVALSHGHYDHSGGFRSLAAAHRGFDLVVGAGFFADKYAERNGGYEFLGNDFTEAFLRGAGIPLTELAVPTMELIPGVYALGSFPRRHRDERVNPRFKLRADGGFAPDPFDDEIMVVVDTPRGLVALLGCAHPGMRNMLDAAAERFGRPLYAVLGGTHLVEADEEARAASLEYLRASDARIIGVSHCTGQAAMGALGETESRYFHNRTGTALVID